MMRQTLVPAARSAMVVLLLGAASVGGCAAEPAVEVSKVDPVARAPVTISPEIVAYGELGYRLAWTSYAASSSEGMPIRSLQVLGDVVVSQDDRGAISCIADRSGEFKWGTTVSDSQQPFNGFARDGKRLVGVLAADAWFMDLETGNLLTRQHMSQTAGAVPMTIGQLMIYGGQGGVAAAHELNTGFQTWAYKLGGLIELPAVKVTGTTVALASSTGDMRFIDVETGSASGSAKLYDGPAGPLSAGEGMAFVASKDQSLYALNPRGGKIVWRFRTDAPFTNGATYSAGRVYADVPGRGMIALDAQSGKSAWTSPGVSGRVVATRQKHLIVWTGSELVSLEPVKGEVVTRQRFAGLHNVQADQVDEGSLYLTFDAGKISKLSPR